MNPTNGETDMKRIIFLFVFPVILLIFSGCGSAASVSSGMYYAQSMEFSSDGQTITIAPYLGINEEDQSFCLGSSIYHSSAETGTYHIKNNRLIAETGNTTLVFEIKDSGTLVLVDDGGYRINIPPIHTEFVLSERTS